MKTTLKKFKTNRANISGLVNIAGDVFTCDATKGNRALLEKIGIRATGIKIGVHTGDVKIEKPVLAFCISNP